VTETTSEEFAASSLSAQAADRVLYARTLAPHRSLSRKARQILGQVIIALILLGSLRAITLGAWPVAIFLALELGLLVLAGRVIGRFQQMREHIALTPTQLIITTEAGGITKNRVVLEPYWAKISLKDRDTSAGHITISTHAGAIAIASFLTDQQRYDLAKDLESVLQSWRANSL